MNTIRIPTRYTKQFTRLTKEERSEVVMGLLDLANGKNLQLYDTPTGDLLELIWGDCVRMERKNGSFDESTVGELLAGDPLASAGDPLPIVYDSIVEDSILLPKKIKEKSKAISLADPVKDTVEVNVPPEYQWVRDNAPTLLKMKDPLTVQQSTWFKENYPEDVWQKIFLSMENYAPLTKKSKSANLTARNWLQREGWLAYERMKSASPYEAKDILCPRAMEIYKNKTI